MKLIMVEGPFDALAAATTGHLGLAAMGKLNLKDVIEYLKGRFNFISDAVEMSRIIVVPDLDYPEFGGLATQQLALAGIRAQVRLPDFEDLAAMTREQRERLLA